MLSFALLFSYYLKARRPSWMMHGRRSARRTEELSQADDSYFCQPQSDIGGWKRSACGRWGGKQRRNHLNRRENSISVTCKCFVLKSSEEWQSWWRCGHLFSLQRLTKMVQRSTTRDRSMRKTSIFPIWNNKKKKTPAISNWSGYFKRNLHKS